MDKAKVPSMTELRENSREAADWKAIKHALNIQPWYAGLASDKAVCEFLGISRSKWWGLVRLGRAPPPVKLDGATRWPWEEILAYRDALIAERNRRMGIAAAIGALAIAATFAPADGGISLAVATFGITRMRVA